MEEGKEEEEVYSCVSHMFFRIGIHTSLNSVNWFLVLIYKSLSEFFLHGIHAPSGRGLFC